MTHFFTVALVPDVEEDVEDFIAWNLDRYDENLEVDPHIENCMCLGAKAQDDADEAADRELGSVEIVAERFKREELVSNLTDSEGYCRYLRERKRYTDKHIGKNIDRDEPDPGCERCHGTGRFPSTYNTESKFDYYVVGGRFNGCVLGLDTGGFESESLASNVAPVLDIDARNHVFPIAIVTPDGKWVEKGTVGMFGHIQDEMQDPEWEETVRAIYNRHTDCVAVGLDCHI